MQINYNKGSMAQREESIVPVKVKLQLSWRFGMFNKDFIIVIKIAWAIRVSIYV